MRDHKPISLESHLATLPLFFGIAADDLERIARSSKLVSAPKGTVLFRSGDPCSGFHLLVYGQVKLAFTSTQGTEKIVEIVQQGQTFGNVGRRDVGGISFGSQGHHGGDDFCLTGLG